MQKGIVLTVINLLIFLLLFSCKERSNSKVITSKEQSAVFKDEKVSFQFKFPDTVFLNKTYRGEILYKSILDTISTKLGTKGDVSRFIEYHYTATKKADYTIEFLKNNIKLDTVSAISVDTIPFYNIRFNKLGVNYIDGIIDDGGYINNYYKDGKMRVITNRVRATHKVIVVDSTQFSLR